MKRTHKNKLIDLMEEFLELVDETHPQHEYHSGTLALHMAAAAQAVYDASQRAQVYQRRNLQAERRAQSES